MLQIHNLTLVAPKRHILQPSMGEMCNSLCAHLRVDTCLLQKNKILLKITYLLKLNLKYLELHIYKTT